MYARVVDQYIELWAQRLHLGRALPHGRTIEQVQIHALHLACWHLRRTGNLRCTGRAVLACADDELCAALRQQFSGGKTNGVGAAARDHDGFAVQLLRGRSRCACDQAVQALVKGHGRIIALEAIAEQHRKNPSSAWVLFF